MMMAHVDCFMLVQMSAALEDQMHRSARIEQLFAEAAANDAKATGTAVLHALITEIITFLPLHPLLT
jgi:hypothetical protein